MLGEMRYNNCHHLLKYRIELFADDLRFLPRPCVIYHIRPFSVQEYLYKPTIINLAVSKPYTDASIWNTAMSLMTSTF